MTPAPTDYSTWSADPIRQACTRRRLKVKGKLKKDERTAILRRHDIGQAVFGRLLLRDTDALRDAGNSVSRTSTASIGC
ncbi:hypothetical protein JG688_00012161 [Phytophthora aleatoria]|uniref:Uncharacterized protein n=1 Tax=Phytophthora aleatoria TaxID=2496075 RepID=A0A8J5IBB0_9STRA|nr:hypothetical protein JG688_00012161 [Phytophthora aleatoria]